MLGPGHRVHVYTMYVYVVYSGMSGESPTFPSLFIITCYNYSAMHCQMLCFVPMQSSNTPLHLAAASGLLLCVEVLATIHNYFLLASYM